jgi:hypothetical protein
VAATLTRLAEARDFADEKQYDKAWPILTELLYEEPDDPKILTVVCAVLDKQGNAPLAYQIAKRVTELAPKAVAPWVNLGKTADALWRYAESANAYQRAMTLVDTRDTETKASIFNNLAALQVQHGEFKRAKGNSEQALKFDPGFLRATHNLGISQLALRDWNGWDNFAASLGSDHRALWKYGDEPTWKGEPGKTVVIYGEQGLGDEICAASMVEDAIDRAGKVILDCDERLATLFARSFPQAKVYGTRTAKVLNWDEEDHQVDYSIAAMQLGAIFRTTDDSWKPKPYLKADPEAVLMWRALWAAKKKPAVGIAWTGGIQSTARHVRSIDPGMLAPLLGIDAHFVNLQYQNGPSPAGMNTYANVTLNKQDYDHTAALVASLDAVVSVPTTVCHLAGALGVPTVAMKAKISCWKYHSGLQFHPCTLVENSGDWGKTIDAAAIELRRILAHRKD